MPRNVATLLHSLATVPCCSFVRTRRRSDQHFSLLRPSKPLLCILVPTLRLFSFPLMSPISFHLIWPMYTTASTSVRCTSDECTLFALQEVSAKTHLTRPHEIKV